MSQFPGVLAGAFLDHLKSIHSQICRVLEDLDHYLYLILIYFVSDQIMYKIYMSRT